MRTTPAFPKMATRSIARNGMGAEFSDDVASTERQARRIRLASAIAEDLTFRLAVVGRLQESAADPIESKPEPCGLSDPNVVTIQIIP
jgi:hypothetical protein